MNQSELLKIGKEILKKENIEEAEIKAKILLQFVLLQSREEVIKNLLNEVSTSKEKEYKDILNKIIEGKPLQYIIKNQEFMGLNFYVDENVLIPQPDTEILVEQTINIINSIKNSDLKVLDLCTGSGAIAISIAKYTKNRSVIASDISINALNIARKNSVKNQVESKIKFIQSDMFSDLNNYKFDIIVSNPPYIKTKVISSLSKEVQHEPMIALDGGEDGLKFYKVILEQAINYLKPTGYVLFEIGYDQGKEILELWNRFKIENEYSLELITKEPIKDLAGNDRVIILKKR